MTNPFPTHKGFGLRLHYVCKRIKELGQNPYCDLAYRQVNNNGKFDNCFENGDADALVYAIMALIHEKNDVLLLNGMRAMGKSLFKKWNTHYFEAKERQLSLFY